MTVSIFNDVIGPVMRGPSSSHCAAALRIGRLARDLMDGDIRQVLVEFDRRGALATTHASQGSDMGLFGGLMGWEATDERLPEAVQAIRDEGITVRIAIDDLGFVHPNTYRLTLSNRHERHTLTALSTGGGMIEVVQIDGFAVSIAGVYAETLIVVNAGGREVADRLYATPQADEVLVHEAPSGQLVELKGQEFVDDAALAAIEHQYDVLAAKRLSPILPVRSRAGLKVPFVTCEGMFRHKGDSDWPLWKLAAVYESARSGLTEKDVLERMREIVRTLRASLVQGL